MPRTSPPPMYKYGKFQKTYSVRTAQKLWDYLNKPKVINAMVRAAKGGIPPVEVLDGRLARVIGTEYWNNRTKMMAGDMVRQVLARKGFKPSGRKAAICDGLIFNSGSTYKMHKS